jgi:hypothetical protein
MHRVIFRCDNKHVWARDYTLEGKYTYFRMEEGRKRILEAEYICPQCNSLRVRSSFVRGTLKESHKCDVRCELAVSPRCDCSCGGTNHGKAHLVGNAPNRVMGIVVP